MPSRNNRVRRLEQEHLRRSGHCHRARQDHLPCRHRVRGCDLRNHLYQGDFLAQCRYAYARIKKILATQKATMAT